MQHCSQSKLNTFKLISYNLVSLLFKSVLSGFGSWIRFGQASLEENQFLQHTLRKTRIAKFSLQMLFAESLAEERVKPNHTNKIHPKSERFVVGRVCGNLKTNWSTADGQMNDGCAPDELVNMPKGVLVRRTDRSLIKLTWVYALCEFELESIRNSLNEFNSLRLDRVLNSIGFSLKNCEGKKTLRQSIRDSRRE